MEGGRELGKALMAFKSSHDAIVLALPRGGVPVAHEVAKVLELPMDIWLVRKLGVPGHEELAMGAIAAGNIIFIDELMVRRMRIPEGALRQVVAMEHKELERRQMLYRSGIPMPDVAGKIVIIVDDGFATGATMRAAIGSLRAAGAARIIAAAPVGSRHTCDELRHVADEVICARTPEPFFGVGQWYRDFGQTSDEEVLELLGQHVPSIGKGDGHVA